MSSVNIRVTVPADRRLVLQLPDDVEPGEATVTVITTRKPKHAQGEDFDFPTLHVKEWPKEWGSLRREEMYGDDGR